eukprot:9469331-Pyramimonas_sp.AAC.3
MDGPSSGVLVGPSGAEESEEVGTGSREEHIEVDDVFAAAAAEAVYLMCEKEGATVRARMVLRAQVVGGSRSSP